MQKPEIDHLSVLYESWKSLFQFETAWNARESPVLEKKKKKTLCALLSLET